MIKQFIKRTKQEISPRKHSKMKRTHKVGVLVAFTDDSGVKVGWSLTNRNAGDTFNEAEGFRIAMDRAIHVSALEYAMMINHEKYSPPRSIYSDLNIFLKRCERYFKD
jgi:hypothetical protein